MQLLSGDYEKVLKSEVDAVTSQTSLKANLRDVQNKHDSLSCEINSLESLLVLETENVKCAQKKRNKLNVDQKQAVTDVNNKLEHTKIVCEKELFEKNVQKQACISGMEDSLVKTREQNSRDMNRLINNLEAKKERVYELEEKCNNLDAAFLKQKHLLTELTALKEKTKRINMIFSSPSCSQEMTPKPLTGVLKPTRRLKLRKMPKAPKKVTFPELGSLSDSSVDKPL